MTYVPPNGFRIKKGETIVGLVWSNVAVILASYWRLIYDSGKSDTISTDAFTTGSSRAVQIMPSNDTATEDGYVVEGAVLQEGTNVPQRGQTYVQILIVTDPTSAVNTRQVLTAGYVYAGHAPTLGEIVEPGPAGGHGAITRQTLAAVGVTAAGKVLMVVPTGAIWRVIEATILYTASATAGTRATKKRWRDASGNIYGRTIAGGPTAGQVDVYRFAPNCGAPAGATLNTPDGASAATGGSISESPELLLAGYDLFIIDTANIDAADTVALEAQVQEWVMPN